MRIARTVFAGLLAGVLCLSSGLISAQDIQSHGPKRLKDYDLPGLTTLVNLKSLDPWDVVQLIEFLAYRGGLNNIVIGKGVSGLTTKLKFDNVTVGDALEVVLAVNNLAYEVKGNIITIMTDEEYKLLFGASFYDHKQVRVVELKYADPTRVAGMIQSIKSTIGTVVADPVTGTLILIDTPEKILEMREVIEKADISTVSRVLPTETRSYALQYADVESIQLEVVALLTKDIGSIRSDKRTKTLIVTDLPHTLEKIDHLVKLFDKRPKEVFIEAKIVQVSLNNNYQLGINWNHVFEGINPRFTLGSTVRPPMVSRRGDVVAAGSGIGSLSYNTIMAGGDLGMIVDALKSVGETRIRSNPHVAVLDGQEATIKVVRDEPYAEAQIESGTTNVVGETFKFIEVGVSLSVTPRINDDRMIQVAIRPEVSTVEGTYNARYSVPIVQKSYAETTVLVKDGETIIIAGMIEDEKTTRDSHVPLIGKIPLIGRLFRSNSEYSGARETVVFMTPRIVSGEEPFLHMDDMKKTPKPMRKVDPRAIVPGAAGARSRGSATPSSEGVWRSVDGGIVQ